MRQYPTLSSKGIDRIAEITLALVLVNMIVAYLGCVHARVSRSKEAIQSAHDPDIARERAGILEEQDILSMFDGLSSRNNEVRNRSLQELELAVRDPQGILLIARIGGAENPSFKKILCRAVPRLIEALKGEGKVRAHSVLATIQDQCPPPDYQVWITWWQKSGRERFCTGVEPDVAH